MSPFPALLETGLDTIGTPTLWTLTVLGVLALFLLDFIITRRPHEVEMKEAVGWSVFYVALPLLFGVFLLWQFGGQTGLEYYTGYLVEKSLSVDNLFVFMLILTGFAVPKELQQRVLLIGVAGALVLRAVFIAIGATLIASFAITFLFFGLILLATAVKVWRDAAQHEEPTPVSEMRVVRAIRRFFPVTDDYEGTRWFSTVDGRRALTPLAVVVVTILFTDVVFAVDSVPAVYGITGDPYLVFVTNAFALLGLRALYFVLVGVLSKLVHLSYGLAIILAFIGVKLVLHWAHGVWPWVPTVPTLASLIVIVGILALVTVTSLVATRDRDGTASEVKDIADDTEAAEAADEIGVTGEPEVLQAATEPRGDSAR